MAENIHFLKTLTCTFKKIRNSQKDKPKQIHIQTQLNPTANYQKQRKNFKNKKRELNHYLQGIFNKINSLFLIRNYEGVIKTLKL